MKPAFQAYLAYYRSMSPDNVHRLRELACPDLHFVDPFNDLRGVEEVIRIFSDMFKRVKAPSFEVLEALEAGDRMLIRWTMRFRSPLIKFGREHAITGVTLAVLGRDDKISEHIDYWDSASQLYAHLPIIGWLIKLLRMAFA